MKICRAMSLLFVMVAMFGVINGCPCPKPTPETTPDQSADVEALKMKTSKFVHITPLNGDQENCIVVPEELDMGNTGIKWVTIVNQTKYDATIKFDLSDTIGDVDPYIIKANEAGSFKLKNPNTSKEHEYSVSAECYEEPIARPKIIIP